MFNNGHNENEYESNEMNIGNEEEMRTEPSVAGINKKFVWIGVGVLLFTSSFSLLNSFGATNNNNSASQSSTPTENVEVKEDSSGGIVAPKSYDEIKKKNTEEEWTEVKNEDSNKEGEFVNSVSGEIYDVQPTMATNSNNSRGYREYEGEYSEYDNAPYRNSRSSRNGDSGAIEGATTNNSVNGTTKSYVDENGNVVTLENQPTNVVPEMSEAEKTHLDASRSGISFDNNASSNGEGSSNNGGGSSGQNTTGSDPNGQGSKNQFLKDSQNSKENPYSQNKLSDPISPYELKAGAIIPSVLMTAINSDLSGQVTGMVRENVFDTITGNYLLIPQGTKVIGKYDSSVTYGQERVLLVWERMILPNGKSIHLSGMQGIDMTGQVGFKDKVDNHTWDLLSGVVMSSVLGAGGAIVAQAQNGPESWQAAGAGGAGESLTDTGEKIVSKELDRQPTLEIRTGYRFNIFVNKDLLLEPYQG